MKIVCLDLEGVLVPEIWVSVAREKGIDELERTTRDEPDYEKLMAFRLDILNRNNISLRDIQDVISRIKPLEGAGEFCGRLREKSQFIILSDTFEQFAKPLMKQLNYPTLFCNTLKIDKRGFIEGWHIRQNDGKKNVVAALTSCNIDVFAAGDSFNDLTMIRAASKGCLFRAPAHIIRANKDIDSAASYEALFQKIEDFLLC